MVPVEFHINRESICVRHESEFTYVFSLMMFSFVDLLDCSGRMFFMALGFSSFDSLSMYFDDTLLVLEEG